MCLCDTPIFEGGGYYAKIYNGYHLSLETSYNLHVSALIGTDLCMIVKSAWWSEPAYVSHCLITLSIWLERP